LPGGAWAPQAITDKKDAAAQSREKETKRRKLRSDRRRRGNVHGKRMQASTTRAPTRPAAPRSQPDPHPWLVRQAAGSRAASIVIFTSMAKAAHAKPCPICRKAVAPGEDGARPPFGPFCSERCKTIDLGAWLDGRYRISRPVEEEDLDGGRMAVEVEGQVEGEGGGDRREDAH
jgi:hypothetical protein